MSITDWCHIERKESWEREINKKNRSCRERLHRLLPGNMFHVERRQTLIWKVDWRPWKPPSHKNIFHKTILRIWWHWIFPPWFKQESKTKKTKHPLTTKTWFKCQEKRHNSQSLPKDQSDTQMPLLGQEVKNSSDEDEFTSLMDEVIWEQQNSSVNKNWILLVNQPLICFVMPNYSKT